MSEPVLDGASMQRYLDGVPFLRTLGVTLAACDADSVTLALEPSPALLNTWQIAHGGVLMSLLDAAQAAAARAQGGGRGVVTVEMKVNFMQPGRQGLQAIGRILHRSTTLAFCEGEVRDTAGQLVAKAMGTFKYLRALPAGRQVVHERPGRL